MKLKPFDWQHLGPNLRVADTIFGRYVATDTGWERSVAHVCGPIDGGRAANIDESERLAFADYERRVGELFEHTNAIVDRVAKNVESPIDFDSAEKLLDRVTDVLQSTDADRKDAEMFRKLVKLMAQTCGGDPATIRAAIEAAMGGGE